MFSAGVDYLKLFFLVRIQLPGSAIKNQACKAYYGIEGSPEFMRSACYEHRFHAVKFPGSLHLCACFMLFFNKLLQFGFRKLSLCDITHHCPCQKIAIAIMHLS